LLVVKQLTISHWLHDYDSPRKIYTNRDHEFGVKRSVI